MKMHMFGAGLVLLGSVVRPTRATIVLNDNFDSYISGTNLVGQGGWLQTSTSAATPIQVGPTSTGLGAVLGTSGQDAYEAFSQPIPHTAGNTLETDMSINLSSAQATGDYFSHLSDVLGSTSDFFQRFGAKSSGSGYVLGLESTAGGGGAFTYGTTVLPFSTDEQIDILWNFLPGTTSDTFAVSVGGTPYAGLTSVPWGSTIAEPTQLVQVDLRQGSATAAPALTLDNYEVQGTVAVPEPASVGLLLFAAGATLVRRKRMA